MKFFSIVVPVSRPEKHLRELMEALNEQNFPPEELEVILVGNLQSSPVETAFACEVCHLENAGANQARVFGEKKASGQYVFFIDDDCSIDETDFLEDWKDYLSAHPEVEIAGGGYTTDNATFLDRAYNIIVRIWQNGGSEEQPHLVGGHLIVRKSVFEKIHFDESIRYGGTETEFCHRALQEGFHLRWNDAMMMDHRPQLTWRQFLRKAYLQGFGKSKHGISIPLDQQVALMFEHRSALGLLPAFMIFWLTLQWGRFRSGSGER